MNLLKRIVQYVFVVFQLNSVVSVRIKSEQLQRPYRTNVCEPNARAYDPKIVCHCSRIAEEQEYRKADCWVYGSDLAQDDVAWDGFGRNTEIRELTMIVYTNSSLTFLPQKGLYYLTDLRTLSISYADISSIGAYAFSKLEHLTDISLITNQIANLNDFAFAKLSNLKSLNASFNQITFIDRHVFYQNFQMELLHLTANNISEIADGAFTNLNNLQELRLDHNLLRRLTKYVLEGLSSVKKLVLTNNYISTINDDTFEFVPTLERLELDQNSITFIGANAFTLLTNLEYVNLEQNELAFLDAEAFRNLPLLNYLNMGKNFLKTFEEDKDMLMRNQFINETSLLLLYDNNLVCDCRLLWLVDLRNRTRSGAIQKTLDDLNCDLEDPVTLKIEPVFLLRLHYEHLPCDDEAPTTPSIAEFTKYREDEHQKQQHSSRRGATNAVTSIYICMSLLCIMLLLLVLF